MASRYLLIDSLQVRKSINYKRVEEKLETYATTFNNKLISTGILNGENQKRDIKHLFTIPGISTLKWQALDIKFKKDSNLYLIDYEYIYELLNGDGSTNQWTLNRYLGQTSPVPEVTVDTASQIVTITALINPTAGNVYINSTTSKMTFGSIPADGTGNIITKYIPKYIIRLISQTKKPLPRGACEFTMQAEEADYAI